MKTLLLILLLVLQAGAAIPSVILDCDIGTDIDDMADVAILHALADRGELKLLATGFCMNNSFGPGMLEALNRYYGRPEIPVGAAKSSPVETSDAYGSLILTNYFNLTGPAVNAPDAISLYRKILAEQPDHSVTFLFTGQMVNLANLWHSGSDAFSPLSGRALMELKVDRIVVVAGYFGLSEPTAEFNLYMEPESAQILNEIRSVPLTFAGTELGWLIPIGARISEKPTIDPVRVAHLKFYHDTGEFWRPSWSGVGILEIARPIDSEGKPIYDRVKGWALINARGHNSWITNANGSQEYLLFTRDRTWYQSQLDELLMQAPLLAPTNSPNAPVVRMDGQIILTPPFVRGKKSVITIENRFEGGLIYYALDGSAPSSNSTKYAGAFTLAQTATLRVLAFSADGSQSAEIGPLELQIAPEVSLTVNAAHGNVSAMPPPINGSYLSNAVVELFPLAVPGWKFKKWQGASEVATRPLRLTMNGSKQIEAIFELDAAAANFSARLLEPGKIELRLTGGLGARATFFRSEDLNFWTPIASSTLSTEPFIHIENADRPGGVFYRAAQE